MQTLHSNVCLHVPMSPIHTSVPLQVKLKVKEGGHSTMLHRIHVGHTVIYAWPVSACTGILGIGLTLWHAHCSSAVCHSRAKHLAESIIHMRLGPWLPQQDAPPQGPSAQDVCDNVSAT